MIYVPFILIAVIIAVATVFGIRRRKRRRQGPQISRTQALIDSLVVQTVTAAGVFVLSRKILSPAVATAIDAAFAEMAVIATRQGYTLNLQPLGHTILIFPSERDRNADGVYCPSFRVYFDPGDAYDGSIYDQEPQTPGGWTFAAEWVIDIEQGRAVIAESEDIEYVKACVHNYLDHKVLYDNDRPRYETTKSHANGGGHPILT